LKILNENVKYVRSDRITDLWPLTLIRTFLLSVVTPEDVITMGIP